MSDEATQVDQPGPDDERRCANCIYWRNPKDGSGSCFAKPPILMLMTVAAPVVDPKKIVTPDQQQMQYRQLPASARPTTAGHDICAEHRYPDEPTAVEQIAEILDSLITQLQGITKYMGVPSGRVTTPGKPGVPQ